MVRKSNKNQKRKPSIWDAYDISKWGKKEWLKWAITTLVFLAIYYACGFDEYFE